MALPATGPMDLARDADGGAPLLIEPVADLDAVRRTWDELAAGSDDVFATPEWLGAWWRHFGRDRPLHLRLLRDPASGRPVALVPLYLAARAPVRVLRLLGHGPTDQLGPVCAVADQARALAALPAVLDTVDGWDLAIADELPDALPSPPPGSGAVLARTPTHAIALAGTTGDAWFAARTPKLRHQLRHDARQLADQGQVAFRTTTDPDRLDRDLDALFDLHHRHWARRPGGSRAYVGREPFHREVARTFLDRGWLRLHLLEVDGRPVAALHSFWFDGVESHYQGGRDPAFDRFGVGLLLHEHAVRACADAGGRAYRFLRGDEPYKLRLADRTDHQVTVAWTRTGRGRAGRALAAQRPRLSTAQARWLPAPWAWDTGGAPRWGRP